MVAFFRLSPMKYPLPKPGETQPQYAVRFHKLMQKAVPLTDKRNALMLKLWDEHGDANPLIEHQIKEKVPTSKFKRAGKVAEFAEHATTQEGEDGESIPVVYDRDALVAVLNRCNERIEDTGDFSPISDGHTPTSEEVSQGAKMPETLGYAGPFYLGMLGNKNPRWAIFADEWHDKNELPRLERLRRRSPEVWMEPKIEDRFLDPVAALGAETPRLDMGWSGYSLRVTRDGRRVMKYSYPGVNNVMVPAHKKRNNASAEEKKTMELSPEAIDQIVAKLMQTEPMQFLQEQMQQGPKPAGGPPEEDAGMEYGEEEFDDFTEVEDDFSGEEFDDPSQETPEPVAELDDDDKEQMSRYMAGDVSEEEMQQYRAKKYKRKSRYEMEEEAGMSEPYSRRKKPSRYQKRAKAQSEKQRYAKLQKELEGLREQNRKQDKYLQELRKDKTEAIRYSRLTELASNHAIDLEEELQETEGMTDREFDQHCKTIERYSEVVPVNSPMLYTEDAGRRNQQSEAAKADEESKNALAWARETGIAGKYSWQETKERYRKSRA